MSLKNLLVIVDESPAATNRLAAAISLAQSHDAHLTALGFATEYTIPATIVANLPPSILEEQHARDVERVEKMMSNATAQADKAGITIEARAEVVTGQFAADTLARHARHADLTIVGQPDPDYNDPSLQRQLLEAAFLETGRPAIALPYNSQIKFPNKLAIVAWDGSKEAARAMNDALPLLAQAQEVRLITIDGEKQGDKLGELPGADATLHLARHGIRAELRKLSSGGLKVSDAILSEIGDSGADLLVMGGYGHSRMRELILGGTTANLLDTMTAATLLSH